MKTHYLLSTLFIALISLPSSAQDWQLFNPSYQYNYGHSQQSKEISNSIAVEDTLVNGTDTTYALNTIVARCDTCPSSLGGLNPCDTCYYVDYTPHFFGYNVQQTDSVWQFFNPGNYTIVPQSPLGNVWTFDSTANVTASFVYEGLDTWFGLQDSTRIAVTSGGDSIVITKSFGITQFPGTMGTSFHLLGIEGGTFGIDIPDLLDIYDFQIGDVFYYEEEGHAANSSDIDTYFGLERLTVTARQDGTGYVVYDFEKERYSGVHWSWGSTTHGYSLGPSSDYFDISHMHIELAESLPQQRVQGNQITSSPSCYTDYHDISLHYIDSLGLYHKTLALTQEFMGDAFTDLVWVDDSTYNAWSGSETMTVDFAEGLGVTLERCGGWHMYSQRKLIGYIKNGVLVGDSIPAAAFLVGIEEQVQSTRIQPYPNPASDQVCVQLPHGNYAVAVYSMDGRLIGNETFIGARYNMDVSELPQALYTIVLAGEQGRFAGRFQVLR
jgi:hypothetical protein